MSQAVLIKVNDKKQNYTTTANEFAAVPPNIQMGLLDAYMNDRGVETSLIDADSEGLSILELIDVLLKTAPDLVGIIACGANPSASTMSMVGVINFFKELSNSKDIPFKTFVWGGHPTVLPERTLEETGADFVIIGEGYEATVNLSEHVSRGKPLKDIAGIAYKDGDRFVANPSPPLVDLDTLPTIDWTKMNPARLKAHNWHCFGTDINNRSPYAIIWTNQGCPYPCDFCCINNVFETRTYRFRSMESVVAEIDVLVNDYGVKHLKILDELFIIKHPRIGEFCDLMEERNYDLNMWCFARPDSVNPDILKRLKNIGLNWVAYGFESFDEDILISTNKRSKANVKETVQMTRDAGINICADVIAGLWDDDESSIKRTFEFMSRHEFEWVNVYPAFGYPGTPLYDNYLRDGIIREPEDWGIYGLYSYDCNPLPTKHLSSAEVLRIRDELFMSYYKDPQTLSMLERKFGLETRSHIEKMTSQPLKRKLLEPGNEHLGYPAKGLAG
jgi:anaerobic magnesium-protoporphyrin IX monomethyl ester cyclase